MLELVRPRTEHHAARYDEAWEFDDPHRAVWFAIRHLFPSHAQATQTDHDCLMVTWTLRDGRRNCTHFAAPVVIRIEANLLLALWTCSEEERDAIANAQAETVREALYAYDPHSRVPTCGVIMLGD
jgi:hypothetical protein